MNKNISSIKLRTIAAVLAALLLVPLYGFAQTSLTLSVTPPLFRLNIEKGESWTSSIKVINNNPYDITVYPTVADFETDGENGYGRFLPVTDERKRNSDLLANWITLSSEYVFVPREQSVTIPFTVKVPPNASPGGHYAAILTGTRPQPGSMNGAGVGVSSFVSSLLLIKVGGEVVESGNIREFSTDKSFYGKKDVSLSVRFENTGNVHIIPRGDITIYNMWGKERGKIHINNNSDFGNVLPDSVRKFSFVWRGNDDGFEIGRYTATLNLSFGSEGNKNVSETISFWVVPLKPTLGALAGLAGFILFMTLSIRAYIRRTLDAYKKKLPELAEEESIDREVFEMISEPVRVGVVDLRRTVSALSGHKKTKRTLSSSEFLSKYRKALAFLAVGFVFVILGSVYVADVTSPFKGYSVWTDGGGGAEDKDMTVKIISGFENPDDLKIKQLLERNSIKVDALEKVSDGPESGQIIIRHKPKFKLEAEIIDQILGSSSLVEESSGQDSDVIIIVPDDVNN